MIIFRFFNYRWSIKNYCIIIFNRGVFWISNLDITSCKCIYLTLVKNVVILLSTIIKECTNNLGSLVVHKFNIKNRALCFCIFPRSLRVFLGYSCFDLPIEIESVQGLNGSVINFVNVSNNLRNLLSYLRVAGRYLSFLCNNWFLDYNNRLSNNWFLDNNNRLDNWLYFQLICFRMRNWNIYRALKINSVLKILFKVSWSTDSLSQTCENQTWCLFENQNPTISGQN